MLKAVKCLAIVNRCKYRGRPLIFKVFRDLVPDLSKEVVSRATFLPSKLIVFWDDLLSGVLEDNAFKYFA